jgi:RHS repeat-associated protein
VAYSYDGLQRLTGVTAQDESWSIGWQFDEYGNRLHQNATGWAANRVANATNRSFDGNNRFDETGYAYDEAGNVTQVPSGGGTAAFAYDGEGRLTAVNTNQVQYVYDYAGRRVKRITAQETRYYVYGLTGLMSEFTTADSGLTDERAAYVIPEHNGTGVLFVGGDGAVIESNRTLPFGELWEDNANSANAQKFTTYDRDDTTGLDYAMARWYASREGRFMSPDPGHVGADPSNPQSWNGYVYVINDPVNFVDPNGLCRWSAPDGSSGTVDDGFDGPCFEVLVYGGQDFGWFESLRDWLGGFGFGGGGGGSGGPPPASPETKDRPAPPASAGSRARDIGVCFAKGVVVGAAGAVAVGVVAVGVVWIGAPVALA